jgi:hypothetical protein
MRVICQPGIPAAPARWGWAGSVPVHVVAARLGHGDPPVTLRVYAHVIRDQVAVAAEIFARDPGRE